MASRNEQLISDFFDGNPSGIKPRTRNEALLAQALQSGGGGKTEYTFIEESEIEFVYSEEEGCLAVFPNDELQKLSVGDTVSVEWDGTKYDYELSRMNGNTYAHSVFIVGNTIAKSGIDNSCPFVCMFLAEENIVAFISIYDTETTSHKVKVSVHEGETTYVFHLYNNGIYVDAAYTTPCDSILFAKAFESGKRIIVYNDQAVCIPVCVNIIEAYGTGAQVVLMYIGGTGEIKSIVATCASTAALE